MATEHVYSSVVDAPRDEAFGWHERPGAIHRLTPPWQPVRVSQEAGSLRDGQAVLTVPPGVRWVAEHSGYDPPRRFVDELTSLPLRWRHVHEFDEVGEAATRLTDRVDTPLPGALLRPMFAYRHRQLAADLAAHRRMEELHRGPLTVAVTGSSGLVGAALAAFLTTGGHRVIRLVRRTARTSDERTWRPDNPDPRLLDGVDAVVHLAGAPIAGMFTPAHKHALRESRVGPTRRLAELAATTDNGPRTFITASAIGYYGPDRGDAVLAESSESGDGFLADLVRDWEAASDPARVAGVRVVNVRTGIVQSPRGGTLRLLYPLFAAGLGGRLGGGQQWMSWIGIDDLVDIYHRAILDEALASPVNAAAPQPVRNIEYTQTLARVLRRPALLPVPALGPQLLLGPEGASELALADQRVHPQRLLDAGHYFRYPDLRAALAHVLGHEHLPEADRNQYGNHDRS
ncbi:MAG: TIGR01777 family oxidoreductase [Streptosporangiales bacterium]